MFVHKAKKNEEMDKWKILRGQSILIPWIPA